MSFSNIVLCSLFAVLAQSVLAAQPGAGAGARDIVLNYEFARPEVLVRDGRAAVSVGDCPVVGAVGEPLLPVWVRTVALRDGEIVTKVTATIDGEGAIELEAPLEHGHPAFSPFMTDAERAAVMKTDVPNAAIYASDGPWPSEAASCGAVEFLQTYPVVSLRVFPVRYLPNASRLAFATRVTVTITCENSDAAPRSSLRRHTNRRGEVMEKVDNPGDVPRPPLMAAAPAPTGDFVEVKIELRYAIGSERAARYSVDGAVLATEAGETWLPLGGDACKVSEVGVTGTGALGDFFGRYFDSPSRWRGTLILLR